MTEGDLLHATSRVAGTDMAALRPALRRRAAKRDLPLSETADGTLSLAWPHGTIWVSDVPGGVALEVRAARADRLHVLKEAIVLDIAALVPAAAEALRWSDATEEGAFPANFQTARVAGVEPAGDAFLRVHLEAGDLSRYGDDAIHFTLALPADPDPPVWPRLGANGRTIWPEGPAALHRAAYTARSVDPATGRLTFDVFLHEGGPTTDWARRVSHGAPVGLVGPGGGGIPRAERITFVADETGYPAVARSLETLPASATGRAILLGGSPAARSYPVTAPEGVELTWIAPSDGRTLSQVALDVMGDAGFLWAAGERTEIKPVRAAWKARGGLPRDAYIAAYWTKSETAG